ncbi:MAG TPA: 2-oxoglutarate dehydrogenase E1 component [Kiritimatiellia bacterium]|nr:2-oxoglutarate dehydrogenase E1 component [Kiritimatiellia bacterium]HMP00652.1 2-oxoglutarate dehydrogenase E1 component [Kiritimatiellia bacterium]HMP97830.1 2-oxoglutarate dehydrogenase E1 component [Kiritimatiellia bacterium]
MIHPVSSSHVYAGNADFLDSLYREFLNDPSSVEEKWRSYFETLREAPGQDREPSQEEIRAFFDERRPAKPGTAYSMQGLHSLEMARKQSAVLRMIHAYRLLGHLRAAVDPIQLRGMPRIPELEPTYHGLADADFDLVFNTGGLGGQTEMPLRDIIEMLKETYTESIGAEFMHIADVEQKEWIQHQLEITRTNPDYPSDFKVKLLERLTAAEGLETHLHQKYVGQKRFSLEGGEVLITALDEIVQRGGAHGLEEIVIGMAHRGRLNVLINLMGKSPAELFSEFEGKHAWRNNATGDVKYHQGSSADVQTPGGVVHLALGFNPSHLEIIAPVTVGSVRSRQERRAETGRAKVMAVLIHGDAAVAGQGVVYETLQLAKTRGYGTGGSIHIVVNNRIGFTISHPQDARSSLYCTDVGKVIQAPIFHVNGDDPEAVAFITQLAVNFRMKFRTDVFIDIVCYRRHGHNEADEPAATQPMMYRKIRKHDTVRKIYADRLTGEGILNPGAADEMLASYRARLEAGEQVSENIVEDVPNLYRTEWSKFLEAQWHERHDTGVPIADIKRLGALLNTLPEDFELHPRVAKIVDDRIKMAAGALPLDWGFAETMAYATLLENGYAVRISGQDSGRGTFFHRHAVLHNMRNGDEYIPLQHVSEQQPKFTIIDSILSEEAVLGFEYGYSAADPNTLVIWEAQFGDFVNGAQVIIDQFIVAAEQKWGLLTGLVMFLPHGWEGQGPEHTSARLERFLQLCAQENIQVCYPTTAAQMFHLLRREMIRPYRKPLVVMTPKSTLRRKISFSTLDDLTTGSFRMVIGEEDGLDPAEIERVVLCSGKVYFDILETRRELNIRNIALVRVEQLYPFPSEELTAEIAKYPKAREVCWAQEEPQNQGAWYSIQHAIRTCMTPQQTLYYSGRVAMAAPAGGDYHKSIERQRNLINHALTLATQTTARTDLSLQPQLTASQSGQPQLGVKTS